MLSKLSASRQIVSSGHLAKKIQPSLFLNKRFFATNESQITPNSTEYENTQERKDLKRSIAKKSPTFMRLWYALGVAGIVGATMYYMNEDDRYERKVEHVLKQIGSHDQEIRRKGIESLDSCLFLEKRLFSGVTEIPQSKDYLIKEGVVDVLLEAFKEGDEDIKYKSAIWLLRLVSYEEARNRIVANSNGIPIILQVLSNNTTNPKLWLSTSSLLLELAKYKNIFSNYYADLKSLESKMYGSNPIHPLAPLIAAKLNTILINSDPNALELINYIPSDKLQLLTSNSCEAAVKSALNAVIPKEPTPLNPPDALLRGDNIINLNALLNPLLFGIFGSVWGNLRWRSAAFLGGLRGQELQKFTTKYNRVGRYVFFLLVLDPIAETLMAWPSKGVRLPYVENPVQIPSQIYGYPVSTYVPICESVVFVASSLYAIRYQKYVVLPLSTAILAAHFDQAHNFVKPYLESAGLPDPIENIEKAIKSKLNK